MREVEDERLQRLIGKLPDGPAAAAVARAEYERLSARRDRLEEDVVVVEIVLEIGVLNEDDLAGRMGETGADRVPLAACPVLEHELYPRM